MLRTVAFCLYACVAVLLGAALSPTASAGSAATGLDQTQQKDAFESAKELGSVDAWNAFLKTYPSGFYADMARAYLKKLGDPSEAAGPAERIKPSSTKAVERSCSERASLHSERSNEPTKITFVNNSGMYRGFMWIDFDGHLQDRSGLNSGEQVTFDTYRGHPWMITTGPGDCLQIFISASEPTVVDLVRLAADDGPPAKEKAKEKKTEAKKPKPQNCAKNFKRQSGKCVPIQNCGKNAARSSKGNCYCKKGYVMRNGSCVWPQDSKGFEVAPWKKTGCKTWQAECNRGNGQACMKYEETCQVN